MSLNWRSNRGNAGIVGGFVPPLGLFTGGSVLAYATSGGTQNNLNPGGTWPSALIGRLDVTTTTSSEIWAGLAAVSTDGYGVLVKVIADGGTGNTIQLNNMAAGQTAGNQFFGSGNLVLSLGQSTLLVYNLALAVWFMS